MAFMKTFTLATALAASASALPRILPRSVSGVIGFPLTGGSKELSLTDTDLSQVFLVTLGRGVQNYTCPPAAGTTIPKQTGAGTGAVAQLFDITSIIASSQSISGGDLKVAEDQNNFANTLTNIAVGNPRPVLDDVPSDGSAGLGELNGEFPKACFHEFTDTGVPKFDCGDQGIIFGTKLEAVDAPASATTSPDGAKAVPWLNLAAKEGSKTISKVIRVVTAGGSPPSSCDGVADGEVISVDYAAQYWFFNNGTLSG